MSQNKVMLLDGYSTRTLACVRSFGRNGIDFVVGGESKRDMSLLSIYAKEKFVYTGPRENLSEFISDINKNVHKFGAEIIIPTSEAAILACNKYYNEIEGNIIIPNEEKIKIMFNKKTTLSLARHLGIRTPMTEGLCEDSVDRFNCPSIIKPECSFTLDNRTNKVVANGSTSYVYNKFQFSKEYWKRVNSLSGFIIQPFINGFGVGISGIFKEGIPVVLFQHIRIRESNPMGGPSAVAESVSIDKNLFNWTINLMGKIGYSGPAMVEYKIDRVTGDPYLMEINGRLWGSILLPLEAGLDLPYIWWKVMNNIEISPGETAYKIGIKGRYLLGDTKNLLLALKGPSKDWPGQFPTRIDAIKEYTKSFFDNNTKELLLIRNDRMPFFGPFFKYFSK